VTRPVLSSSWRTQVQEQIWRLDNDVALLRPVLSAPTQLNQVEAGIRRAQEALEARSSPPAWWSGRLVEQAWGGLQVAREDLILVQDETTLRAQIPYLRTLVPTDEGEALVHDLETAMTTTGPIPRERLAQVQRRHDLKTDVQHASIRQIRNKIIGTTLLLVVVLIVAALSLWALGKIDLLKVMGVGAAAGTLTSVVPLAKAQGSSGPYSATGAQIALKVPAGAAFALLGVLLLQTDIGGLKPATGGVAYFYAVIFGFAQQTFTQLVDKEAQAISAAAPPRTGPVAPPQPGPHPASPHPAPGSS
jgi:hypothetical protein